MKRWTFTLFTAVHILLITQRINAQNPATELVNDIIEDLAVDNSDDDESDWSQQLERLAELREEPINLNSATLEELCRFPFLTSEQAENIILYIQMHGPMKSLSELMLVREMSRRVISLLYPFICVKTVDKSVDTSLKDMLKYGRHEAVARLDIPLYTRQGYSDSYLGPSLYQSVKYKFNYKRKLSFGFGAEKDAGEPFGALCNKKGYDYYSAHLLITDVGLLKTLIIGDYGLNFGQGLVVNTDFTIDNSTYIFSSPFLSGGISKHTSTAESNYFCGSAATLAIARNVEVTPFYSRRLIDAKIDSTGNITTISTTGLHRTADEMARKQSAALQLLGANIRYNPNRLRLGATAIYYWLDRNYSPSLSGYRKYNINGNLFYNIGLDYGYRFRRFTLLGEAAKGKRGVALLNKLRYDPSSTLHLLLLHRYYSHDYWNLFASAYSRGGSVSNENGWYLAADFTANARTAIFASVDAVSFPWKKYRISQPSTGLEAFLRTVYTLSERGSLSLDYRLRKRDRDKSGSGGAVIYTYLQHRLRAKFNYALGQQLALRTTLEGNIFHISGVEEDRGFRITQSATLRLYSQRIKLQPQLTLFLTDNYDSRVFVSEPGMLYSGYSPSFYGRGIRWSANGSYKLLKGLTAMGKVAQTIYFDRQQIGSGNDMIDSNRKTDLQLLIQYKF